MVNSDHRAHDHENLFVLGSPIFSASGRANSTFTIGALVVRLANPCDTRPGTIACTSATTASTGS
ncbi:MAG: hypothetical protein KBG75_03960 [Pseudomonadales bacterium]|nr:hypothetical protein [Pseudomonadales bacterium]